MSLDYSVIYAWADFDILCNEIFNIFQADTWAVKIIFGDVKNISFIEQCIANFFFKLNVERSKLYDTSLTIICE